jgi:hypothetical protein
MPYPERKSQVMSSVRSEIALANAQELINVSYNLVVISLEYTGPNSICLTENEREMLRQMCHQAFDGIVKFRGGEFVDIMDQSKFLTFSLEDVSVKMSRPLHGSL